MKKIQVILDVDGLLLNWIDSFDKWVEATLGWEVKDCNASRFEERYNNIPLLPMTKKDREKCAIELINEFNASDHGANLLPMDGAITMFDQLIKLQKDPLTGKNRFELTIITFFGGDAIHYNNRRKNLNDVFGPAMEKITLHCKPFGSSKNEIADKYYPDADQFILIEDNYKYAIKFADKYYPENGTPSKRRSILLTNQFVDTQSVIDAIVRGHKDIVIASNHSHISLYLQQLK